MQKTDKVKITPHDKKLEIIIKQHRHWTHWISVHHKTEQGNLVLTNHRLLFLHKITDSPNVAASIKELADAPIETVLNHALTLHKNNFQIPLSSIIRVRTSSVFVFPFPHFYLRVSYRKGKNPTIHNAAFQFVRYKSSKIFHPQIIADWGWMKAIRRTIREKA
ncbi:MAG: hypothetical protein NTV30_00555 [Chloroflexi bacterium]|nr:hypothetical protein [Chloroflexota bacterium]